MARINVSKGSEIEGLEIDDAFIAQQWPGVSDANFTNAIIGALTIELVATVARNGQTDPELAAREVVRYIKRVR